MDMPRSDLSQALADYSLRAAREAESMRRAVLMLGTASLVASSAWLMACALDRRDVEAPVAFVRHAPPPSPPVTLRPLPVQAAVWEAAPGVPPLAPAARGVTRTGESSDL
jgi:hypothetical protein